MSVKFEELTEEEEQSLQYAAAGSRTSSNAYGELLEAVKAGKKVKVGLEGNQKVKNLKWNLSQAGKRANVKLEIKVLADQSGVVVSSPDAKPAPPTPPPDGGKTK